MIGRAGLWFRTVRHLRFGQIRTRAARVMQRMVWRLERRSVPHVAAPPLGPHRSLWSDPALDEAALRRATALLTGTFSFLGESRVRPGWADADVSHLWRYHLHYFDYARDLAVYAKHKDRRSAYACFVELAGSWIDDNGLLRGDGWHPYTISLRLVNWCEAAVFFAPELLAEPAVAEKLYGSIAAQACFLARNLENDVRGNHLLENCRALIRVSFFFDGEQAMLWRRIALSHLQNEVVEQILPDGGHFERVPGYHVRVLDTLQDIDAILKWNDASPQWLTAAIERMREFLRVIVPPTGRLPQLKDTVQPPNPLVMGTSADSQWLSASGFAVMREDSRGDFLIADFGKVCPDYLPAHAHADMFSYELTVNSRPIIVDSGVYEYTAGRWRDWFRSTPAHNTVAIDGKNQSEVWNSFRVGRRAHPQNVVWSDGPEAVAIQGEHNGYRPVIHHRLVVALRRVRIWIIVDRVDGEARRRALSYIHLHPDVTPATGAVTFVPFGSSVMSEAAGWYSERFGSKCENRVLVLEAETPAVFGYAVSCEPGFSAQVVAAQGRDALLLQWVGGKAEMTVKRGENPVITVR